MGYEIIVRKYDDEGKMLEENKVNNDKLFDGYIVVGDQEIGCTCEIEHMSKMDIANCIEADETLLFSAILAEAMERGKKIVAKRKRDREMKEEMRKIFGDIVDR